MISDMSNMEVRMKKIIITTTFRDFKGNINDKMQLQFLNSLTKQTYQNYVLVVTIFKEKNVERVVKKILGEKAVFYNSIIEDEYRYSLSKVLLNGIDYGKEIGADILIDCSGDIILQNNFLETVVNNYSELYSGISHPNIFFDVNENFEVIKKRLGQCNRGIDIRFFDFKLLVDKNVYKYLQRYTFLDWGGFEHFLTAICIKYSSKKINIFNESKVVKFENNRELSNETEQFINRSSQRNQRLLMDAARAMNIDTDKIMDLYYIHLQYQDTKPFPGYYILKKDFWIKKFFSIFGGNKRWAEFY